MPDPNDQSKFETSHRGMLSDDLEVGCSRSSEHP